MEVDVDPSLELIAAEAFDKFIVLTRHSNRTLADAVALNRGTIDRLRRGKQKTLETSAARRIEKEFGLPEGTLFLAPEVTRYLRVRAGSESVRGRAA